MRGDEIEDHQLVRDCGKIVEKIQFMKISSPFQRLDSFVYSSER